MLRVRKADWRAVNGTSLQGYVRIDYATLCKVFGKDSGGGDKTTAEWALQFNDGVVATIYDWKEYSTPMHEYDWHVGGRSARAVANVEAYIEQKLAQIRAKEQAETLTA